MMQLNDSGKSHVNMSTHRRGRGELNVKALLGAFNHENALVGAFSVIVKL